MAKRDELEGYGVLAVFGAVLIFFGWAAAYDPGGFLIGLAFAWAGTIMLLFAFWKWREVEEVRRRIHDHLRGGRIVTRGEK
jgi:hypothetical protein